jgi:hypothetical protein
MAAGNLTSPEWLDWQANGKDNAKSRMYRIRQRDEMKQGLAGGEMEGLKTQSSQFYPAGWQGAI